MWPLTATQSVEVGGDNDKCWTHWSTAPADNDAHMHSPTHMQPFPLPTDPSRPPLAPRQARPFPA